MLHGSVRPEKKLRRLANPLRLTSVCGVRPLHRNIHVERMLSLARRRVGGVPYLTDHARHRHHAIVGHFI